MNVRETIPPTKVQDAIERTTRYILDHFDFSNDETALVGIQTRGVSLSKRIAAQIKAKKNIDVPLGALDITLYRDDIVTSGTQPVIGETNLDFDIDGKTLVLIDDVLFTGRTIRAALDEIIDFGRPKRIALVVLIDRGHRELPIEPSFAAIKLTTDRSEVVSLHLEETDHKDEIVIGQPVLS